MYGAGLRIDPEMNSGSRMSYYTGLFLVNMTDDLVLPAPREATTPITGYPEGFWLNLVSWSQDGKHIAFTVRSPGNSSDNRLNSLYQRVTCWPFSWHTVSPDQWP